MRATARFCGQCGSALATLHDVPTQAAADNVSDLSDALALEVAAAVRPHAPSAERDSGAYVGAHRRYRLGRLLGKGGFGEAYLAHDTSLDRPCVVKLLVLDPAWGDATLFYTNFEREARLLVSLNTPGHPNIPEIYEYIPERHALVMKYIAGQSLADMLNRRLDPLPEEQALRYIRDICSALAYMHSRAPEPVLHRDIKPANILLGDDGRVWLIDFGLAKATLRAPTSFDRQKTQVAGTPGYTPPEQWRGAAEPQSDIYALAVTLYMLLTNYQPSRAQLYAQVDGNAQALPPLCQLNPAVRPQIEQLVERAMAADPAQRPSALAFLAELDAMLNRPHIPAPLEPAQPPDIRVFVGRANELDAYYHQLQADHLATIVGPAGIGKTAIAAMLARRFDDPARTFWHAFHEDEGIDSVIWDLASFLAWNGQEDLWQLLQSARLTGGQPPPPEALCDYVIKLLHGRGYLLCLDDFQFVADDPLLDLLVRRVASEVQAGQVALLITSRTTPSFIRAATDPLAGLSADGARALLDSRGLSLPAELVRRLAAATSGNAQLLHLSIDALQRASDPARVIAHLAEVADIERYLLNEVDAGLDQDERALMEALAALLGYPAPPDVIEAVLDSGGSVRRILSRLTTRNLIVAAESESGRAYIQHSIIQAFYYESIPRARRAAMHSRAASHYAQNPADTLQALRHHQLAGEWARAADLATEDVWSIINAGQAHALQTALAKFAAPQLDQARWVAVLLARGDVDALLGSAGQARASYQDALEQIATLPDAPSVREQYTRACYGMGALLEYEAPQAALGWLERGLAQASAVSDRLAAALYIKIGTVQIPLGNYAAAQAALVRAEALLPDGPSQLRISALHTLGTLHSTQGAIARGMEYTRQGLEICAQLNDHVRMAKMLSNLAIDKLISADMVGARADFQRALELAERIGSASLRLVVELNVGVVYARMGDDQAALQHIRDGVELARAAHTRVFEITGRASLADIYVRQGALDLAANELAEAERLALEIDAKAQLPEIYRSWARVMLAQDDLAQAQRSIDQSLDLARAMQLDMDEGLGLRVLGQVLIASGQRAEAEHAFARSIALLDSNDPYEAAVTRVVWGQAVQGSEPERGRRLIEEAQAVFQAMGAL